LYCSVLAHILFAELNLFCRREDTIACSVYT
jgi:hypothetical protein